MTIENKQHYIWKEDLNSEYYTTRNGVNVFKPLAVEKLDEEDNNRFIAVASDSTLDKLKRQHKMTTMLRHMSRKYYGSVLPEITICGYSTFEEACKGLDQVGITSVFEADSNLEPVNNTQH